MDQFLRVGHHLDNKISQGNDSTHMSDTLTDIKDNTGEYLICYLIIFLMKIITIIDYFTTAIYECLEMHQFHYIT